MYGMPPWMIPPGPSQLPQTPAPTAPINAEPSPPQKRKYPAIAEWLQGLDDDEDRGEDKLDYHQYATVLNDVGIIRLDDLLEVGSVEKLQELTEMNWGTAKRLMKFAGEDKQKMKRARIE